MKYYDDDCPEIYEATAIKENDLADRLTEIKHDDSNRVTGDQA